MLFAGVAQLVEQLIRNQQVTGSSPVTSSIISDEENQLLVFSFGDPGNRSQNS